MPDDQPLSFAGAGAASARGLGCAAGSDFGADGAGGGGIRDEADPAGFVVLGDDGKSGRHRGMEAAAVETDVFLKRIHRVRKTTIYPMA